MYSDFFIAILVKDSLRLKYFLFNCSISSSIVNIFLFEFPYLSSKYKAFVSNVSDVLFGFHNVASSISDYFGLENIVPGNSFLNDI